MNKQPMNQTERDAMSWLFLGMMIASDTAEWPAGLEPAYFTGREQLARAVADADLGATAAQLRSKFAALAQASPGVLDDPLGMVAETVVGDALMLRIGDLAGRAETRRDGAFDPGALRQLSAAIGAYLDRAGEK